MTTQLTRLARAVVEATRATPWADPAFLPWSVRQAIDDLAAELDRTHPESPDGSAQFDRALESDAELDLPRPSESEAPPFSPPPFEHGDR